MNTDPYAPPTADLDSQSYPVATSLWRARGRLGMLAYWAQSGLLTLVGALATGGVAAMAYGISGSLDFLQNSNLPGANPSAAVGLASIAGLLILLVLPVLVYIAICMIIKRLHDLGLSGWWSLLLLGTWSTFGLVVVEPGRSGWWSLLLLVPLLGLLFSLYVFLWPGKVDNRFGAPTRTRGWEKLLGGLFLLLTFSSVVAGIYLGGGEYLLTPDAEPGTQASIIAATISRYFT